MRTPTTKDPHDGLPGMEGQHTVWRYAKNNSLTTAPSYNPIADNPGNNWSATPPITAETEYLWMITSDWQGITKLTSWSSPVRITGPKGSDGEDGSNGSNGTDAPKYRGLASSPGTIDGKVIIGSVQITMRPGDWVMYNETTQGVVWIQNRVIRWTGIKWKMVPPPDETNRQNADMYLIATSELTAGAPEAIFSLAQVRSLVASSIFANLIGAKNIILNNDGNIQSENYGEVDAKRNSLGFLINANGNVVFNNGMFRGFLDTGSGKFRGELDCDVLQVAMDPNSMQRFPITGTYPIGFSVKTIFDDVLSFLGISPPQNTSWGSDIIIVDAGEIIVKNVVHDIRAVQFAQLLYKNNMYYYCYIFTTNGQMIGFGSEIENISDEFWIQIGNGLKKIRLVNLPLSAGGGLSGTVFKESDGNGDYFVKVKT